MKSHKRLTKQAGHHQHQEQAAPLSTDNRLGATLIVVMILLTLMAVFGFFAYRMGHTQQASAEYFSNTPTAKYQAPIDLDRTTVFNWAIEQIIKGGPSTLPQTALSGGRHGLVPSMFGADVHPYSGGGYHVTLSANGQPQFDNNLDGATEAFPDAFYNASQAAHAGTIPDFEAGHTTDALYSPDVNYTAPDINNMFLAFRGYTIDANGNEVFVVKPSYSHQAFLRDTNGKLHRSWMNDNTLNGGNGQRLSLRAHEDHKYIDGVTNTTDRFVGRNDAAVAGITDHFPFPNFTDSSETWSEGVWAMDVYDNSVAYDFRDWVSYSDGLYYQCIVVAGTTAGDDPGSASWSAGSAQPTYSYDVDADGDGTKEALWLDLDFPMQPTTDGTQFFIPMYGITIYDADGFVNVNAHGNVSGDLNLGGADIGNGEPISRSNQGLSASEVNPTWVLNARANGTFTDLGALDIATALQQHNWFYNHLPTDLTETSNMEWYFANVGRLQFSQAPTGLGDVESYYEGRYGERTRLEDGWLSDERSDYPQPGISGADDNGNVAVALPAGTLTYPFDNRVYENVPLHPLDYHGVGNAHDATGKVFNFYTSGLHDYLTYMNYSYPTQNGWYGELGSNLSNATAELDLLNSAMIDEAMELELDPEFQNTADEDNQYGPLEGAMMQLSNADIVTSSASSRLQSVMPWNLRDNDRSEEIRNKLTTHSMDLKARGASVRHIDSSISGTPRSWEYINDNGTASDLTDDTFQFPPLPASGTDPFRPALREWLQVTLNDQAGDFDSGQLLQRMLSLNHIVDLDGSGNPYLRRLTPHPVNLGTTVVNSTAAAGSVEEQEYLARLDRQNMARDIYVLLYVFGDDGNTNPLVTNSYSFAEMADMAQFAINAVNQLDRDNILDLFEYDLDLTNGWDLNDDNPYLWDIDPITSNPHAERAVAYGVEAQELAFNEVNVLKFAPVPDGGTGSTDLFATEWNDEYNNVFSYVELKNVLPKNFSFNNSTATHTDNGAWQIEVVVEDRSTGPATLHSKRTLQLRDLANVRPYTHSSEPPPGPDDGFGSFLAPGEILTIVSADTEAANPATHLHGNARVAFDYDGATPIDNYYDTEFLYLAPNVVGWNTAYKHIDTEFHATGSNRLYLLDENFNVANGLVDEAVDNSTHTITFKLKRRVNTLREVPEGAIDSTGSAPTYNEDNPWVIVDEMTIEPGGIGYREVNLGSINGYAFLDYSTMMDLTDRATRYTTPLLDTTKGVDIQEYIFETANYHSQEREELLVRTGLVNTNAPTPNFDSDNDGVANAFVGSIRLNTLGQDNSNAPASGQYEIWQPHFDRDFASPIELLSIPLYGPEYLTDDSIDEVSDIASTHDYDSGGTAFIDGSFMYNESLRRDSGLSRSQAGDVPMDGVNTAGVVKFLDIPGDAVNENRWYRLLSFFEVPRPDTNIDDDTVSTGVRSQALNDRFRYRLSGKINWNTIRSPEVLGALLDEVEYFNQNKLHDPATPAIYLEDAYENSTPATNRDWWVQFIKARDQIDGVGADPVTNIYLPGMPGSRPFQGFDHLSSAADGGRGDTMLRNLPVDIENAAPSPRTLFEVGTQAEHDAKAIDYVTRNRLLAKILNNSTTRSNVFFVFVQVDYFEAAVEGDAVRVGGKRDDSPGYRELFVIDRSLALEELNSSHFPTDPNERYTIQDDFDWRRLVIARFPIE